VVPPPPLLPPPPLVSGGKNFPQLDKQLKKASSATQLPKTQTSLRRDFQELIPNLTTMVLRDDG
jgi:hypothetical protein